ncbi:putative reverse transcriptase, RNA-dependent DNA polymerase, partial [Tanacetum coccineum]
LSKIYSSGINTFGKKVKRRILEENKESTTTHDKPKQQLQKVVYHEIKKLPTHYSATIQNKLPPKETDPGSFIILCIIGNYSMSNALADLGVSISIIPYSLFKRLELGSLKPIKMTIEIADRSMQSPKGIKENVLVKISNFMFLVDFVILGIMEDENILIILGRPMLATAHAKIDVYGKKISLGVRNDQVVFNINKKESPASISPICVINRLDKTQELDDLVMIDETARDFENYLSPEYESQDIISLSPSKLAKVKEDFSITLCDPDKRMSIVLEEFAEIDDVWDDLDLGIMSNEKSKTEFLKRGGRIHLHSPVDFIILENISEFVEKGLTEVLFGQPFKEQIGLVEDRGKGTLWFKIGNDKIIFHMPRAEKAFRKLTVKQHNSMGPLLKVSDEDKKKGIHKPEKKIKGLYKGFLSLGNEYKYDLEVVDWIRGCIDDGMT